MLHVNGSGWLVLRKENLEVLFGLKKQGNSRSKSRCKLCFWDVFMAVVVKGRLYIEGSQDACYRQPHSHFCEESSRTYPKILSSFWNYTINFQ